MPDLVTLWSGDSFVAELRDWVDAQLATLELSRSGPLTPARVRFWAALFHAPVTGRGVALINDQLLEPGARIEGWTLLALSPNEVVLQGPRGRLRLSLIGPQVIERNPKSAQSRRGRKE